MESDGNKVFESALDDMAFDNLEWIDISEPNRAELEQVSEKVGVPIRDLSAAADPAERPRIDELKQYRAVVFKTPFHENKQLTTASLGIFVSEKLLITVHRAKSEAIEKLCEEKQKLIPTFKKGATRLMVQIIEEVMHEYFTILDEIESKIDAIEERVLQDPHKETMREIFMLKKTLIFFHKALTANIDVVRKLEKEQEIYADQINGLRYVHDDLMQMIDVVATYRDLLTGALDIYLSSVSNSMNAIMKRMTAWASIVLIPTFITGLYGMNFRFMPELTWRYGYAFAWGTIIGSILLLYIIFKKKGWF